MIPPWPPSESAVEVLARYQQHTTSIRIGSVLLMLAAALLGPFFAVITTQMMRIEGPFAALSLSQILAGAGVYIFILLPGVLFSIAAFRPERSPEITQTLNDMAWIIFATTIHRKADDCRDHALVQWNRWQASLACTENPLCSV